MTTISSDEIQQYSKTIQDIQSRTQELLSFTKTLKNDFENQTTEKGISLLELKNHLMMNYLIELSHLLLKKVSKKSINNDASVDRLAETRVVLERLRPIESKLKYQIDKLIKLVATGTVADSDPLRFKPNLLNFNDAEEGSDSEKDSVGDNEEDNEEDKGGNSSKKNTQKYVPPKLLAMPYDDDDEKNRKMERVRKRALSSSLVRELQQQYSQAPEEIQEFSNNQRQKYLDIQKQRTQYEEDNLIRLQVTKKQRQAERRSGFDSTLNSLLSFGDYNVEESMANKKKKASPASRRTRKAKTGKKKWKK